MLFVAGTRDTGITRIKDRKTYLLTFGNHAVHKSHRAAKEDKVMQVVHLQGEKGRSSVKQL